MTPTRSILRGLLLLGLIVAQPVFAQQQPPLPISYIPTVPAAYEPFNIVVLTSACDVIFSEQPLSVLQQGGALRITLLAQLTGGGFCNQPNRTLTLPAPPLAPGNYTFELYYQGPINAPPPVLRDTEPLTVSGAATQSVPANALWAKLLLLLGISGITGWRLTRA